MRVVVRKSVLAIVSGVLLVSVVYSLGWYYQAGRMKVVVEGLLADLSLTLAESDADVIYSRIDIRGFPFQYNIEINSPKYIINQSELPTEVYSPEKLVIVSGMFGGEFHVVLPQKINIDIREKVRNRAFLLSFNTSPVIDIKIKQEHFLPWIKRSIAEDKVVDLSIELEELRYSDNGYVLIDSATGEALASTKHIYLLLKIDNYQEGVALSELVFNIKNAQFDKMYTLEDGDKKLGNVSIAADVSFIGPNIIHSIGPTDSNIDIRGIEVASELFSFNLNGSVGTTRKDVFPFGELFVKLKAYQDMVAFKVAFINSQMSDFALPFFRLDRSQSDSFVWFLENIATEHNHKDNSILLTLGRKQSGDFYIGTKTFAQILKILKDAISEKKKPLKRNHINGSEELPSDKEDERLPDPTNPAA